MTEIVVITHPTDRLRDMYLDPIKVAPDTPISVLTRVVGDHGIIRVCQSEVLVLPEDAESKEWIEITLDVIGFPTVQEEGSATEELEAEIIRTIFEPSYGHAETVLHRLRLLQGRMSHEEAIQQLHEEIKPIE